MELIKKLMPLDEYKELLKAKKELDILKKKMPVLEAKAKALKECHKELDVKTKHIKKLYAQFGKENKIINNN